MHWKVFSLAIICSCLVGTWAQEDPRKTEKQILDALLAPERYDPDYRPLGTDSTLPWKGPVKVSVQTLVRALYDVDDINKAYQVQITFRQRWVDDRLVYSDQGGKINHLRLAKSERIWKPDLFFPNDMESEVHDTLTPNEMTRIYPDGEVLYSIRVTAKLFCNMQFRSFPFDRQTCSIQIDSYAYTTKDVVLEWAEKDPVQISKNIQPVKFTLENYSSGESTSKTATGEYSCLNVDFHLKREYGFYQIQLYIPSSMFVIISWLTFWVNREKVAARITMALITLLALAAHTAYFNYSVPMVSYTKAIDMWTGTCLTFVFSALIEFIVVHFMSQRRKNANEDNGGLAELGESKPESRGSCSKLWHLLTTPDGLDLLSRLVFPLLFVLFNIIYFTSNAFS